MNALDRMAAVAERLEESHALFSRRLEVVEQVQATEVHVAREERAPLGRLDRLGVVAMSERIPGLLSQFSTVVPPAFWERHESGPFIAMRCSCGHEEPSLRIAQIQQCPGCEERFFLHDGRELRVARYEGYRNEQDDDQADELGAVA